ncbi:hypothetical protein EIP91_004378 [Steccherinum ochraceum]|uniref:Zn(2)-C6 fungal-type domain-containing protein n=1 Tax=Steccherinum ochraceum TaxID=92696 RepID=A0A4R0RZX1_9APHY|nr:hypothetical protein EIP91_004378 [Steccherinum ochraceum]
MTSRSSMLPRGGACIPCRRRKMRCNGGKPVCEQCTEVGTPEDCEYITGQGTVTRTQLLEETVDILEARIRELEHPDPTSATVSLRSPYNASSRNSRTRSSSYSPAPPLEIPTMDVLSVDNDRLGGQHVLSIPEVHMIIDIFVLHSSRIGFFLSVPSFIRRVRSPEVSSAHAHPLNDILIATACLWGCRFAGNPSIKSKESDLLRQVVQQASGFLLTDGGNPTRSVMAFIQAEVLLANYFFTTDRLLEGRYHGSAALSLVLSCRLNLRTTLQPSATQESSSRAPRQASIQTPHDFVQIGERVNAFWTVCSLYKAWAAASGAPSTIWAGEGSSGLRIEIPPPLSMEACEKGTVTTADLNASSTIMDVLRNGGASSLMSLTPLGLYSRAALLYTHVSWAGSRYKEGMPLEEKIALYDQLQNLHGPATSFLNGVMALEPVRPIRYLLTVSTLARSALIRLHKDYMAIDAYSRETCLSSANSILNLLHGVSLNDIKYIDPIMAMLLGCAGRVYTTEMTRYRNSIQRQPSQEDQMYISGLLASAQQLLGLMFDYGAICPLMISQANSLANVLASA